MAATSSIAGVSRSVFLVHRTGQKDTISQLPDFQSAFGLQRTGRRPTNTFSHLHTTLVVRGQQSPFKYSQAVVRDAKQSQGTWGTSNVGRRQAFESRGKTSGGRIGAATSGNVDPEELRVVDISSHQRASSNPYGYAWWKVALAIAVSAAFFYYFTSLETQMHAVQAAELPKIVVPDKWPWPQLRTPAELEATFNILGEAGRALYKRYLALDFLFPLAYTVLYSQLLGFLVVWSQFWARLPRNLFPPWIGRLAYTVFPWDLLENAAVFYAMSNPGTGLGYKAATAAGYFTWVKFLMVVINVSFMYMGLLLGVFDFVFKMLRNRYDGLSAIIYSLGQR